MNAEMELAVERLIADAVKQGYPERVKDASVLASIAAVLVNSAESAP